MNQRKRAYFLLDSIVALALIGAAATLLATGQHVVRRATRAADDSRAAVRLAERYFAETAAGQASDDTNALSVKTLPTPAPAGWQWVSVRATVNARSAELIGLTRRRP